MTTMYEEKPTRIKATDRELVKSAVRVLHDCGRHEEANAIADLMRELARRPIEVEIESHREFSEACFDFYVKLVPHDSMHRVRLVHDSYEVEFEIQGKDVKKVTRT